MGRPPWAAHRPEEHFNLGGKTKWYGAALLRFAAHEFEADAAHQCRAWPIGYEELAPFYAEAEALLDVYCERRRFTRRVCDQMLRLGYLPLTRAIALSGTAHACGTLVAGKDPNNSVVDADGRMNGLDNL